MYLSRYNIMIDGDDGGLLIFNTLHNRIIRLDCEHAKSFRDRGIEDIPSEIAEFLKQNKMMVDEDEEKRGLESSEQRMMSRIESTLSVTLIPSFQCNFNCPYCYENHSCGQRTSKAAYDGIIKIVRDNGFKNVDVHLFGGEPLLFLGSVSYLLDSLKEEGVSIGGGVTTNGFLLTKSVFKRLLDYGIRSFQITIDGDRECHDRTRCLVDGTGTYETIMNRLRDIRQFDEDFDVIVRCNAYENTSLESFFMEYERDFRDDKRFSLLLFPVMDWNGGKSCGKMTTKQELFGRYTKELRKRGMRDVYFDLFVNDFLGCSYSLPNSFVLMPDDRVDSCTVYFDKERDLCIEDYGKRLVDENDIRIRHRCDGRDCALYPRCLGFMCHKADRKSYCSSVLEDLRSYIKEYFL